MAARQIVMSACNLGRSAILNQLWGDQGSVGLGDRNNRLTSSKKEL
jgi:hypothetical protein